MRLRSLFAWLLSVVIWWYAVSNHRLVDDDLAATQRRQGILRNLLAPGIFLLSIGIAFFDDDLAKYSWLLIAVIALYDRPIRSRR